jgi:hypothetical protein
MPFRKIKCHELASCFSWRGLYKNSFHVVGLSYPSDEASKYSLAAVHA